MKILIFLLFATPPLTSSQNNTSPTTTPPPPPHPPPPPASYPHSYLNPHPPLFEPQLETNLTAQVGSTVFLACRVKNLGNKSVTWLRSRDAHILTVDRFLFISDSRFTLHHPTPSSFTLAIRHVQPRDTGRYECQVTTSPKSSLLFELDVVTPQTRILGEPDVFVLGGSLLSLKCVIYDALEEPEYVFWFHDGARVISFSQNSYTTQTVERLSPDTTLATLTVKEMGREDGGNYSCAPRNLEVASVTVHVMGDEHPAAMQQKETTSSTGKNKVVGGGGAVKFEVMWGWVGLVMGGMLVLYM